MKFQHLILPLLLWVFVGLTLTFFVPTTPLIISGAVLLIALATYFSVRVVRHDSLPLTSSFCFAAFLLSSIFSGFNPINLLLIIAIGTLATLLTTNH